MKKDSTEETNRVTAGGQLPYLRVGRQMEDGVIRTWKLARVTLWRWDPGI